MIKNILLDWSGTLADDLRPVLKATNAIFKDFGRDEMTIDQFRQHFRLPFSGFYAEFLPQATEEGLEALYERFFHGLQDEVELIPGAQEFLDFCRDTGRRTFLLSTIKSHHFDIQSARLGVRDYFEHPYVQIMDKREKIRDILRERQLNPAETIFVGDMVHDIETARHGGIMGVAVLTGFDSLEKLATCHPSIICHDLTALKHILS